MKIIIKTLIITPRACAGVKYIGLSVRRSIVATKIARFLDLGI